MYFVCLAITVLKSTISNVSHLYLAHSLFYRLGKMLMIDNLSKILAYELLNDDDAVN